VKAGKLCLEKVGIIPPDFSRGGEKESFAKNFSKLLT
jgi:hypothetical protein